jgi:hypothetical protein
MMIPPDLAGLTAASGSDPFGILSILGGLIAVLIVIAGGIGTWAALRVSKNTQVLSNYKTAADSWEARARALEAEKNTKDEQIQTMTASITELHAKNAALMDMASGHPAIERLAAEMRTSFDNIAKKIEGG